jgi:hypothetical protein
MAWVYLAGGFALNVDDMTREQVKGALQERGFVDLDVTMRRSGTRRSGPTHSTTITLNADNVAAISEEPLR